MKAQVESIDPIAASDLLENVGDNRPINEKRVKLYVRQMIEGRWTLTGQPIIVDKDGRLADGQHRLWAVVESGVTVDMLVVRDAEPQVFAYLDTGKSRTAADLLHMAGYQNVKNLAAMARMNILYERGGSFRNIRTDLMPIPQEVLEWVEANPKCDDLMLPAARVASRVGGAGFSQPVVAGLWYVFQGVDADDADAFFESLKEGLFTEPDDPIYLLRERLSKNGQSAKMRMLGRNEICALTIKAWNFWRTGEGTKVLKWTAGGEKPEPFPVPV